MAATMTINGSVTLDELLGLQNSGVPGEGDDDRDVSLSELQSQALASYNRLFNGAGPGGLGLRMIVATSASSRKHPFSSRKHPFGRA